MGIDIESGPSGGRALYSVMVVNDSGEVVYKGESVPLSRIIMLAWELRPSVIALDNVFELADNEKKLLKVFSMLPPETRVVQVTASQEGLKSVRHIARESGLLEEPLKLTPREQRTLWRFSLVKATAQTLESRGKDGHQRLWAKNEQQGGWSQQRYQRRVRAAIQNVAKAVREALDKAKLDYDYSYRESKGSLESAVFTVLCSLLQGLGGIA